MASMATFVAQPIGFVSSPYNITSEIPKGVHAKHEARGHPQNPAGIRAGPARHRGLFSSLCAVAVPSRAGIRAGGQTALRRSSAWCVCHALPATSKPHRPHRGCCCAGRCPAACARGRHAQWHADSRHQTLSFQYSCEKYAPRLGSRKPKHVRSKREAYGPDTEVSCRGWSIN